MKNGTTEPMHESIYAIRTQSGWFDYENPEKSRINYEDIARSLSHLCRYNGHCKSFYSIGTHVLLVHELVSLVAPNPVVQRYALHHDDHEAFRGDIPTPRKKYLEKHQQLYKGEEHIQDRYIYENIVGLQYPMPQEFTAVIKEADTVAFHIEFRRLFDGPMQFKGLIPPLEGNRFVKLIDSPEWEPYFNHDLSPRFWRELLLATDEQLIAMKEAA